MQAILAVGCYWGEEQHSDNWVRGVEIAANASKETGGFTDLLELRHYPALILLYTGGVAALAGGRFHNLRRLLLDPKVETSYGTKCVAQILYPLGVMDNSVAGGTLPGMERHHTALSQHLWKNL